MFLTKICAVTQLLHSFLTNLRVVSYNFESRNLFFLAFYTFSLTIDSLSAHGSIWRNYMPILNGKLVNFKYKLDCRPENGIYQQQFCPSGESGLIPDTAAAASTSRRVGRRSVCSSRVSLLSSCFMTCRPGWHFLHTSTNKIAIEN